jgi:hypothetical protein
MKRRVNVEKVRKLCIKTIVDNVSGIKFAQRSEGIYNYTWAGNKRFYVEVEESIIDYSITFRAIVEGVCFYEDIITEDVEGMDGEAIAALCWTTTYTYLIEILFERTMHSFDMFDSKVAPTKQIMGDINWASLLLEVCFRMNTKEYNLEGAKELDKKAYDLIFEYIINEK